MRLNLFQVDHTLNIHAVVVNQILCQAGYIDSISLDQLGNSKLVISNQLFNVNGVDHIVTAIQMTGYIAAVDQLLAFFVGVEFAFQQSLRRSSLCIRLNLGSSQSRVFHSRFCFAHIQNSSQINQLRICGDQTRNVNHFVDLLGCEGKDLFGNRSRIDSLQRFCQLSLVNILQHKRLGNIVSIDQGDYVYILLDLRNALQQICKCLGIRRLKQSRNIHILAQIFDTDGIHDLVNIKNIEPRLTGDDLEQLRNRKDFLQCRYIHRYTCLDILKQVG